MYIMSREWILFSIIIVTVMIAQANYYKILGVEATAGKTEICEAYKELALKHHPSLRHENHNEAYNKFCKVGEAFDVLYHDEKRRIYDQYGEQSLKEGIVAQDGRRDVGNYVLTTQPQLIFERFFGSKNVHEHLLQVGGKGQSHPIFSSQYTQNTDISVKKVDDLVVEVQCLLSELFNGCKKVASYQKEILSKDGQSTQTVTQTKEICIPAGYNSKIPITFAGEGNQYPGEQPSELLFRIIEVNTMGFSRCAENPANLLYRAQISLMDALDSKPLTIKQLDGQLIHLHFDEIINPKTQRTIQGKGMPTSNGRGSLLVRFDIIFPDQLEEKEKVVQLLSS